LLYGFICQASNNSERTEEKVSTFWSFWSTESNRNALVSRDVHSVWQLLIQLISSNCRRYEMAGCIIYEDLVWHSSCTWNLCCVV